MKKKINSNKSESYNYKKKLLISIIIPTYNSARYFESSLTSLFKEIDNNYPNTEVIVIDGFSNDGTIDIIKKHKNRISYWVSESDSGLFEAINKGILKSKGQIIGILDSDDIYYPGALSKIAKAFEKYPDEKLIYGQANRIDLDGNVISSFEAKQTNYKELAATRCFIPCQSAFFKKEVVPAVGLMNTDFTWVSDWEYWIRVSKKFGCKFIDEILGAWRINPDGKTYQITKGYYKRNLENIKVSFKYTHNPFTPLIRGNIWGLLRYFSPITRSKIKRYIKNLKK